MGMSVKRKVGQGACVFIAGRQIQARGGRYVARLTLRIGNYAHILRAYGQDAADAAVSWLHDFIIEHFHGHAMAAPEEGGVLTVVVSPSDAFGHAVTGKVCEGWVETLCFLGSVLPVATPAGTMHLLVSGTWTLPDGAEHGHEARPGDGPPVDGGGVKGYYRERESEADGWAARYRGDMAAAAKLLAALDLDDGWAGPAASPDDSRSFRLHRDRRDAEPADDQLVLDWQPVCNATEPGMVLYYDARPRFLNLRGGKSELVRERRALERIGLAGLFDGFLVRQVIGELENDPDVTLGVTISAQSVHDMPWWRGIYSRLADNPGLAHRLVIAIAEADAAPDAAEVSRFVAAMHRLGCLVAMDDFGLGHASIRQLIALSPDIVRIGHFFLEWAMRSCADREVFTHLTGLARALVPIVVMDGVQDGEQSRVALEAGVCWQQGALWGDAGSVRMWLAGSGRMWHFANALGAARSDPIRAAPSVQRG